MENLSAWWCAARIATVAVIMVAGFIVVRGRSQPEQARGGEIEERNGLLQEGAITPIEVHLLKRWLLAGQVA